MRPVIDTIKSDKIIDENFESIKNVLCGNVSYDNMSIRILEGTTTELPDTQNQVIHSGTARPVGWFPLVGDVYVQEISDRYIDVRSTKPQVNYKIMILFGNAITDASLKAIGGSEYQDTTEYDTSITDQQIQLIEEVRIQYKPVAIDTSILPNPCDPTAEPSCAYNSVITDGDYFYIIADSPTANDNFIWRINRTTLVVDSIDFSAEVGTGYLCNMIGYGTYIYITAYTSTPSVLVLKVDIATFTLTTTYTIAATRIPTGAIYVNDTHIYVACRSTNSAVAYIYRIVVSSGASSSVEVGPYTGSVANTYSLGQIIFVSGGSTDALFVVLDNNFKACFEVVRIAIYDWVSHTHTFTITDTIIGTEALNAKVGLHYNGNLYIPVSNGSVHRSKGGECHYLSGMAVVSSSTPYAASFIPMSVENDGWSAFEESIQEQGGYLYTVSYNPSSVMGIIIHRLDTVTNGVVNAYVPLAVSGKGVNALNSTMCREPDGTLLYIKNTSSSDASNFEYAEVDFSDYDSI